MASVFNGCFLKLTTLNKFSKCRGFFNGSGRVLAARFSTEIGNQNASVTKNENEIIKSVFISQSNDIFTNLAIEDWIYKNTDFNNHHVLLIWRNAPCVVIGRHQNPWMEANMEFLSENGIDLARRNSGGGTVYHDKGNLNLTFFTPRERYNRKSNLEIITRALFREWGVNINISEREDLLMNNHFKVSGTASKLGRPSAYHHCTLLVDANKLNLKNSLIKSNDEIETNATRSIPSPIRNLKEANYYITPEKLLSAIGWEYLRTTPISMQDGGKELISKQRGFQLINPTDKWFPGLAKIRDEFISWEWRFGKTPKFTASRTFPIHDLPEKIKNPDMKVALKVEKGEIMDVSLSLPACSADILASSSEILSGVQGKKYSSQALDLLEKNLVLVDKKEEFKTALRA